MDGYDAGYWKHGVNVTAGQFCNYIKTHIPPDAVLHVCGDNQVYLHFSPDGNALSMDHDPLSDLPEYEGCQAEELDTGDGL